MLYEELIKEIQKEIESIKNSLAYGAASDYSRYCESVGTIAGLEKAIANGDGVELYILSNTYSSSIEQRSLSYARDLMLLLEMCENGDILPQNKVELSLAFAREEEKQVELTKLLTDEK